MAVDSSVETARRRFATPRIGRDIIPMAVDVMRLGDVVLLLIAGMIAYEVCGTNLDSEFWPEYGRDTLIGCALLPFLFERRKLYRSDAVSNRIRSIRDVLLAMFLLLGVLTLVGFATKSLQYLSREWVALWFSSAGFLLVAERMVLSEYFKALEAKGLLHETIAIVGAGPRADRLLERIKQNVVEAEIIGVFDDRGLDRLAEGATVPRGTIEDLIELGRRRSLDRVLVTLPWSAEERLLQMLRKLKSLAVDVELCPEAIGFSLPTRSFSNLGDLPLLLVANKPLVKWGYVVKRAEDVVLGGLLLLLFAPLLAAIAVAIKMDSPGPVLFRQKRHGFNNTLIEVYKFRSMRHDTADYDIAQQTLRSDPRITRLGRLLRSTSLDELPQLINVLKGEMSLVGPRPHGPGMRTRDQLCHEIVEDYAHRHRVRPGITGWAQVNGYRGATHTEDQLRRRVECDIYYIEHWSLLFDLKILFVTFFKVLSAENAF